MPSTSDSEQPAPIELTLYWGADEVWQGELAGRLELGRQDLAEDEPPPYAEQIREDGTPRLIIAESSLRKVSRQHVLLVAEGERLAIHNISFSQPIQINHVKLPSRQVRLLDLGAVVRVEIADFVLVVGGRQEDDSLQSLFDEVRPPGTSGVRELSEHSSLRLTDLGAAPPEALMGWLANIIDVLQSAAGSQEFLPLAAQAAVNLVELDHAHLLQRQGDEWIVTCSAPKTAAPPFPSRSVLRAVIEYRKTFWQSPTGGFLEGSLMGVHTVIATPILNAKSEVIGALYGERRHSSGGRMIGALEARMFEVLACAVASGLARMASQASALLATEQRTQLQQFFSPQLAERLLDQPSLLNGKAVDVTVMFCDVREFTSVSDRLESEAMLPWIKEVHDVVCRSVLEQEGVLVDFIGDAVFAMWGAPIDQPDQAARACRAAMAIGERLPAVSARWMEQVGQPTDVSIGISSGRATVGNIGSQHKFKYGPVGRAINVGSRVQHATRQLGTRVLLASSTARQLPDSFPLRRIGRVRLNHLQAPETLYELCSHASGQWRELQAAYESALAELEHGRLLEAAAAARQAAERFPEDGPCHVLLKRIEQADATHETLGADWTLGPFDG